MDVIFNHAWIFLMAVTFINAIRLKSRSKQYIEKDPSLKEGYDKLIRSYLIFVNIPWAFLAIGDISGLSKNVFDVFTPWKPNPVVLAFHASVIFLWILGSYWIYFNNGAMFLTKHPGLLNLNSLRVSDNSIKNLIKIFWAFGVLVGIVAEIQLWNPGKFDGISRTRGSTHPVYDFATSTPDYKILLGPLLFVGIGIGVYLFSKKMIDPNATTTLGISKRKYGMFFGIMFGTFAGLFLLLTIIPALGNYYKTSNVYKSKSYQTIEGVVTNFHPMPYGGHDTERFEVNGVPFEYSDFIIGDYGYHNAASHGGVIKDGLKVKISYFNNGKKNVILILDTN